jgi:hypothetical protein
MAWLAPASSPETECHTKGGCRHIYQYAHNTNPARALTQAITVQKQALMRTMTLKMRIRKSRLWSK